METKVSLTGDQLIEIIKGMKVDFEIDLDNKLVNISVSPMGVKSDPDTLDWPDAKGSEPTSEVINYMRKKRDEGELIPADLMDISYQRMLRMARTAYQKKRQGLYLRKIKHEMITRANEVEETIGLKFREYEQPTNELIQLYRKSLPKNYDRDIVATEIRSMKTLMKPRKGIADLNTEFKSCHLTYTLYTHGIYTITDLRTLESKEAQHDPILAKMHELAWSRC